MTVQQLITEHLDIWTAAHKTRSSAGRGSNSKLELVGIKKLRELILELAVRGKLVPQDTNDEPASELLKRIAAEKASLVKQKKIKKTKILEGRLDGEEYFDAPQSWSWVHLNDLGDWGAGSTPSRRNSAYYGGNIPWFKSGELNKDFISKAEETVTELALKECSLRKNKIGDVLIAMYGATIGKSSILSIPATTNQAVCACTPFSGVYNRFLLLLLRAFKSRFIGMGAGGAQPNISREKIVATFVPLPPLAEQHRIVAKVDELMAFCDQLEQAQTNDIAAHAKLVEALLASLTSCADHKELQANWQRIAAHFDTLFTTEHSINQLKQTILQLAVMGKLASVHDEDTNINTLLNNIFVKQKLRGLNSKDLQLLEAEYSASLDTCFGNRVLLKTRFFCDFITKGTTPKKNDLLEVGEIPFLKVYNIVNNSLDFNYRPTFITVSTHSGTLNRSKVFPDDVIMNIVGPPLGKVAIITDEYPEWNMNQALAVFRPLAGISSRYLYYMLSTKSILESALIDVKGTAGQDNLSLEQCRNLFIPIPSCEEQHRIVTKVEELMTLCDTLLTNLQNAQATQLVLAESLVEQAVG